MVHSLATPQTADPRSSHGGNQGKVSRLFTNLTQEKTKGDVPETAMQRLDDHVAVKASLRVNGTDDSSRARRRDSTNL